MRYKTFFVRTADGTLNSHEFEDHHYRAAGMPYSPASGLPQLEALTLVNKWNQDYAGEVVYWLGGSIEL